MKLSNWNPFKFSRKNKEEKQAEGQKQAMQAQPASSPIAPFDSMQQLMQQFFRDPFFSRTSLFSPQLSENRWFGDFSPSVFSPSVDVVDEDKALRITAELPGLSQKDVSLSVDEGSLTIKGEKRSDAKSEEKGCYRTERAYGYFQRVVPLPSDVDRDAIEANFDKGVLTVRIPKTQKSVESAKQVPIKGL